MGTPVGDYKNSSQSTSGCVVLQSDASFTSQTLFGRVWTPAFRQQPVVVLFWPDIKLLTELTFNPRQLICLLVRFVVLTGESEKEEVARLMVLRNNKFVTVVGRSGTVHKIHGSVCFQYSWENMSTFEGWQKDETVT